MSSKTCIKCEISKDESEFRGRRNTCRECERIAARDYMRIARIERHDELREIKKKSYQRTADKVKERSKTRYEKNKEKILAQVAQYRDANREYIRAWHRNHYTQNKERMLEVDREYRRKNKDATKARMKRYREMHRAETRMRNRLRKVALKFSNRDYTSQDWNNCLAHWQNKCAICNRPASVSEGRSICADHWIPLAKGGVTHKSNILPLCHGNDGCNNKKHDKDPIQWLIAALGEEQAAQKMREIEAFFNAQ